MTAALQIDDFAYLLLLLVHILAVLAAFGGVLAQTIVVRRAFAVEPRSRADALAIADVAGRMIAGPSFVLAGLMGMSMVLFGQPWEFSQTWISIAFVLWIAGIANAVLLIDPTSKAMAGLAAKIAAGDEGDEATLQSLRGRIGMATGFGHLLILALVVVMIWGSSGQI